MAWSLGVLNQRKFDFAADESTAILAETGQDFRLKIPSLKQRECELFVQGGIGSRRGQYFK